MCIRDRTGHAYNEQGLANRVTPDSLPPVEWLTYGSGYLAGMKLGGTPLVEYTRDRPVSYTHLRAHETDSYLVCRLLLEKKKTTKQA